MSADDYLPYSFHRKAPYLVWDDERSSACRRGLSARSRSRSWSRAPARCCPWPCVFLVALAFAVLFGSLVALCAYLSAITSQHIHPSIRLLGVVKVVEGDVWDPSLLNSTSKEFRNKSAKYANMLQAAYRKSPQLNSSLSKVTIYAFRQGSLIVLFELEIDKQRTPATGNLETKFKKTLQEEIEKGPMGAFGNLKIDEDAIELKEMSENNLLPYNNLAEDVANKNPDHGSQLGDNEARFPPAEPTNYWSNENDADSTGQTIPRGNDSSVGSDEYNSWQPFFPEQQGTDADIEGTTWDDAAPELGDDSDHLDAPVNSSDDYFQDSGTFSFPENSSWIPVKFSPPPGPSSEPDVEEPRNRTNLDSVAPSQSHSSQASLTNSSDTEVIELTVGAGVVVKADKMPLDNPANKTSPEALKPSFINIHPPDDVAMMPGKVEGVENPDSGANASAPEPPSNGSTQVLHGAAVPEVKAQFPVANVRLPYKPLLTSEITVGAGISIKADDNVSKSPIQQGVGHAWQIESDTSPPRGNTPTELKRPIPHRTQKPRPVAESTHRPNEKTVVSSTTELSVGAGLFINSQPSVHKNNRRKEHSTTARPVSSTTEFEIGVGLYIRPPNGPNGQERPKNRTRAQERPARPEPQFIDLTAEAESVPNRPQRPAPVPGRPTRRPSGVPQFGDPPSEPIRIHGTNKGSAFIPLGTTREGHHLKHPELNITSISVHQTVSTSSGDHSEIHSVIYSGAQNAGGIAKFISGDLPSKADAYDSKYSPVDEKGGYFDKISKNGDKHSRPSSTTEAPTLQVVTRVTYSVVTSAPLPKDSPDDNDITKHYEDRSGPGQTSTTPLVAPTTVTVRRDCDYLREIQCKSGECVPQTALCDRKMNCIDGSDERNCSCKDYLKHEKLHHKICDGILDCWDFTDEIYCPWCNPGMFVCPGAKQCVSQEKVCNGNHDCPYGLDEVQCIGLVDEQEESTSMSSGQGFLQLKRNGIWGKLCIDQFPRYLSNETWSLGEIGHAACNTLSYRKVLAIRRTKDKARKEGTIYFEMRQDNDEKSSIALMYKETNCPRKEVLHITCSTLECGIRPLGTFVRKRIVGGHSSAPGSWPWQVALYKEGEFQCGAALVGPQWLITAGHCFYNTLTSHWTARLGMLRRGSEMPSPFEVVARVSHAVIHPQYIDKGFANDIALLKLEKPVEFSDYIRPICLPTDGETVRPRHTSFCVAVGWGKLLEVGRLFPDTLQEVPLPVLTTEECRRRTLFLPLYNITENMFCAGYERGGRDACLGDSGGPLMCQKADGRWSLVGVTSNGDGCGRPGRPGVYTKVMRYLPWIHHTMETEGAPKPLGNCSGVRCRLGRCMSKAQLCDGTRDCYDGRDEEDCPDSSTA
ncbi:unnamed protein product [Ixodes hexagonus]